MKKVRTLLAIVLAIALLASIVYITEAEQGADAGEWQADLTKLMNPDDVPKIHVIRSENTDAAGDAAQTHDIACEITVNDVAFGCEFTFDVLNANAVDWDSVQQLLGQIVTEAARTSGSAPKPFAEAIHKALTNAMKDAQADEAGNLPAWSNQNIALNTLRVSTPFYPELSVGKNGDATKRLQQKLIEQGFLIGSADGYFGEQTKNAVIELENYVRQLEQELIDARPTATPAPTATAQPVATNAPTAAPAATAKHVLTLLPEETPAPTEQPTASPTEAPVEMEAAADAAIEPELQPATPADGVAEALLQAYLYSDSFCTVHRELKVGDSGIDVARIQRRLRMLGCSVDAVDGAYGAGTARGIRVFQHYNGLSETGIADVETQRILFSASAVAPQYAMLAPGSSGDAVKQMQTRLKILGFTNASPDGDYGDKTKTAIETLQTYMRDREIAVLQQYYGADQDITDKITIEVNGIADSMLLEDFYSDRFPSIPQQMQNGSKNDDVARVQRRLYGLNYLDTAPDGDYGSKTEKAIRDFQKRHKLNQTGVADAETLSMLFSENAMKALKPYMIKVSTGDQRVYVYGLDDNNEYTVMVKKMKCSTGRDATPTPKGTYTSTTGPGARWHYFKKFDCWAQYAYYIQGDIMFHSVLYNEKEGRVTQSSVNNLGRKASHGCVRLSVEDAKWIYQNCAKGTTVVVY